MGILSTADVDAIIALHGKAVTRRRPTETYDSIYGTDESVVNTDVTVTVLLQAATADTLKDLGAGQSNVGMVVMYSKASDDIYNNDQIIDGSDVYEVVNTDDMGDASIIIYRVHQIKKSDNR